MFDVIVSRAFEDGHKALQIGFDVGIRVLNRIANASLRCKMNHSLGLLSGEDVFHSLAIGDTLAHALERVESGEARSSRRLETALPIKPAAPVSMIFILNFRFSKLRGATNGVESLKGRAVV